VNTDRFGGRRKAFLCLVHELVLARQHLSDQEKWLATARLDLRTAMEAPQGRQGESLVQPPNHADTTDDTELDEAEQQSAISKADPSTVL
jgi:hypothetical protein